MCDIKISKNVLGVQRLCAVVKMSPMALVCHLKGWLLNGVGVIDCGAS